MPATGREVRKCHQNAYNLNISTHSAVQLGSHLSDKKGRGIFPLFAYLLPFEIHMMLLYNNIYYITISNPTIKLSYRSSKLLN